MKKLEYLGALLVMLQVDDNESLCGNANCDTSHLHEQVTVP